MSDLKEHFKICKGKNYWCRNEIAECNACGKRFNERTGKEVKTRKQAGVKK